MKRWTLVVCCTMLLVFSGAAAAEELIDGVTVREDRPRIWMTPERIEALKAKAKSDPVPTDDPAAKALMYILTGDEKAGREAVDVMLAFDLSEEVLTKSVASDQYRWQATVPMIYDWCNGLLSDEEKATFVARYGRIADMMNQKRWGGPHMPGSNYYSGYMRNSGFFGLAAAGETPLAAKVFADALATRWRGSSLPYYAGAARGGITGEGSQYDRYNIGYVTWLAESLRTAAGIDIMRETNWFREFAYYTIYSTSSMPVAAKGNPDPYYQRFPFGDCEFWNGHPAVDVVTGDSMRAIALSYADEAVGKHAAGYVFDVEPPVGFFGWVIEDGRTVEPGVFDELPLDYFAPGAGYAFMRSGWREGATQVMLQLGAATGGSHQHLDAGTFQVLRAGSWMTKESTGYSTKFKGTTSRGPLAHNSVLFDGRGQANAYADGPPEIIALATHEKFFHAAVDLSKAYRASTSSHKERDDTPGAAGCVREFLYIRPDLLIVFDRLESTSADVKTTFVTHFAEKPEWKVDEREEKRDQKYHILETSGGSQFSAQVVYPEDVSYELIDEGDIEGWKENDGWRQWRVEASQSGQKESYFLTVMAASERFDHVPNCELVETEDTVGVIISQPGRKCQVYFNKKIGDSLGKLIIDAAGAYGHAESSLPSRVQEIAVDADGVHWGESLE